VHFGDLRDSRKLEARKRLGLALRYPLSVDYFPAFSRLLLGGDPHVHHTFCVVTNHITNNLGLCLPCAARKRRIPLPVDALSSPIAAFAEVRGLPQLVIRVR
jgi:hypothetical protein